MRQTPCAAYKWPHLAAAYDAINPPDADYDFYVELAGETPLTILDIGCGAGRPACELATRAHRVVGADPSPAMLVVARNRPDSAGVTWIEADAATLRDRNRFDLIIMTGHVFQVLLNDRDVRAALDDLGRHPAPQGRLAFETRNSEAREWESWIPEKTRECVSVDGAGKVKVHYDIQKVEGEFVAFETHFSLEGDDHVSERLAAFLEEAGFTDVRWFGGFDRRPLSAKSAEIIVIASEG